MHAPFGGRGSGISVSSQHQGLEISGECFRATGVRLLLIRMVESPAESALVVANVRKLTPGYHKQDYLPLEVTPSTGYPNNRHRGKPPD